MKNLLALASVALAFLAVPPLANAEEADRAILEEDVRILADDAMEGRQAGTPGYDMAVDYVASRYTENGLIPGGDVIDGVRQWDQRFTLVDYAQARAPRMSIVRDGTRMRKIRHGEDFVGGATAGAGRGSVEAEVVFVGYGLEMPELGYDDLAGLDLEGKIVMWVYGQPEGLDPLLASHLQQSGADRFAAHGAIGSILLWSPSLDRMTSWAFGRNFFGRSSGTTWLRPDGTPFDRAEGMQFQLVASPELSRALLEGQSFDFDDLAQAQDAGMDPLPSFATGLTANVNFAVETEHRLDSSNVIGVLPGTDPELADEYVVVTAHLDHIGMRPDHDDNFDQLYNGAMDNATGVATMLQMAWLLAADPPRRPILFVALGAEEMGLLGSEYHAAYPGLEAGELAVNVNVDMPILTWPFSDIVAFGADRSNLFDVVNSAAAAANLKLVPDPNPDEGFFFRSDQYSYIQQGIPAVYLDVGFGNGGDVAQEDFLANHYHQPSDEAHRVDYEQLGRFAEVAHQVARNIADMDERAAWNADDFFGTTFGGPVVDDD